jgi:hypothetical protein
MDGSYDPPECVSCGETLTAEEIGYYETTCEKCERKFLAEMRGEFGVCRCLQVTSTGDDT